MTAIDLSGAHGLAPRHGEVVSVEAGTMLVFAERPDGRRLPITTLAVGEIAVGCAVGVGTPRLYLTGVPGTRVRTATVGEELRAGRRMALENWIHAISDSARGQRWVERVVVPSARPMRLAPGEHVVATSQPVATTDTSVLGWLRVTAGTARFCDWSQAMLDPSDGVIPMTRGAWLTSGLHSRIAQAPPPADDDEAVWIHALDLIGGLVIAAACQQQSEADARRTARLAEVEDAAEAETSAGVVALSGAFSQASATLAAPPAHVAAAWWVAQEVGLAANDAALQTTEMLLTRGVPAVPAVAEACGARVRGVRLPDGWWREEGPPLVAVHNRHGEVALRWQRGRWLMAWPAHHLGDVQTAAEVVTVGADEACEIAEDATQLVALLPSSPTTRNRLLRLATAKIRPDVAGALAMSALIAIAAFATPYVLGQIAGNLTTITLGHLLGLLGALILLEIATNLWRGARGLNLIRVRTRAVSAAAMAVWDRMIRQRARWHADRPLGQRLVALSAPNLASNALPNTTVNALLDSGAARHRSRGHGRLAGGAGHHPGPHGLGRAVGEPARRVVAVAEAHVTQPGTSRPDPPPRRSPAG